MRRFICLLLLSFVMFSCGISEVNGSHSVDNQGNIWGGPLQGTGPEGGGLVPVCYMTAVDYLKDYDWRADQSKETIRCSLVVYADGSPIMKVPVGADCNVSSDPDMHRIVSGHLYTDYPSHGETIIKKDGTLLFSYPGEERIVGMHVRDADVYTLGESRSGEGFSFRKNGETIVLREKGTLLGRLNHDGDSLSFAFYDEIRNVDGNNRRYYSVYGNKVSQIALREDLLSVWDVFRERDDIIYVASLAGISQPVIVAGKEMFALDMPKGTSMTSCTLFKSGEKIGVEGVCRTITGARFGGIWLNGERLAIFPNLTVSALCTDDYGVYCALNPQDVSSPGKIYRAGEIFDMPPGYGCMSGHSLTVTAGIMQVGLSSLKGKKPLVWKDGQIDSVRVNGYISMLYADMSDAL